MNPAAENTAAFRECVIIRHPRRGEYAFAFITGQCTLHGDEGAEKKGQIRGVGRWGDRL